MSEMKLKKYTNKDWECLYHGTDPYDTNDETCICGGDRKYFRWRSDSFMWRWPDKDKGEVMPEEKMTPKPGRLAVADWSGRFPEDTEDGILWVDETKPLRISAEEGDPFETLRRTAHVTEVGSWKEYYEIKSQGYTLSLTQTEYEFLKDKIGMKVELGRNL